MPRKDETEENHFEKDAVSKRVLKFMLSLPGWWIAFKAIETGLLRSKEPEWFDCYSTKKLLFLLASTALASAWIIAVARLSTKAWPSFGLYWLGASPRKLFICVSLLSTVVYSGSGLRVGEDIAGQVKSSWQWHQNQTSAPNVLSMPKWSDLSKDESKWPNRPPGASWVALPGLGIGFPLGTSIRLGLLGLLISGGLGWLALAEKFSISSAGVVLLALCLALSVGSQTPNFSTANVMLGSILPWMLLWGLKLAKHSITDRNSKFSLPFMFNATAFYLILGSFAWIKLSSMIAAITIATFPIVYIFYTSKASQRLRRLLTLTLPALLFLLPYILLEKANEEWSGISANEMYGSMDYNAQSLLWGEHFTESTQGALLFWSALGGPGYALPVKGIAHGVRDFFSQFDLVRNWFNRHEINMHAFFTAAVCIPLSILLFMAFLNVRDNMSNDIWLLLGCFLVLPFTGLAILSNLHGFNYVLYHAHTSEFAFVLTLLVSFVFWRSTLSAKNIHLHCLAAVCLAFPIVTQAEKLLITPFIQDFKLPSETEIKRSLGHSDFSNAIRVIEDDSKSNNDILFFLPEGNMGDLILRTRLRTIALHFAKDNLVKRGQAATSDTVTIYCCYPKKWENTEFSDILHSAFPSASDWNKVSVPVSSIHSVLRITVQSNHGKNQSGQGLE